MNINWRNDVVAIVWFSSKGIEFDLNPTVYPQMVKDRMHQELGRALMEFGEAMKNNKINPEKIGPSLFGPNGDRLA